MKRTVQPGGHACASRMRGQALVFALAFLLAGCTAAYVLFHTFQSVSARIKLQNTADAAAYAAAVLQARDYNFAAYTNRAMVANQVTVAQAISLRSWIQDLDTTYTRDWTDIDSIVDQFADHRDTWQSAKRSGKAEIQAVRASLDALLPALARDVDSVIGALSTAQRDFHAATFVAVPEMTELVARENQRDTHATAGYFTSARSSQQLATWRNFAVVTEPRQSGTGSDRFADVVTDSASLDGFVADRTATRSTAPDYQQLNDSANQGCRGNSTASTIVAHVSHVGGTQLMMNKNGWAAIDTSTASASIRCVFAWYTQEIPFDMTVGRGGAANGELLRVKGAESYMVTAAPLQVSWMGYGGFYNFGDYRSGVPGRNVLGGISDQFAAGPGASMSPRGGLQPYMELAGADLPADPRAPRITVEVERASGTQTGSAALNGGGRLAMPVAAAGGVQRALASASAYFVRPEGLAHAGRSGALVNGAAWQRPDDRIEYPNLFSPYWQASLVQTGDAERTAALDAQVGTGER